MGRAEREGVVEAGGRDGVDVTGALGDAETLGGGVPDADREGEPVREEDGVGPGDEVSESVLYVQLRPDATLVPLYPPRMMYMKRLLAIMVS